MPAGETETCPEGCKKDLSVSNLYLALVHYPVVNKNGDTIASAITNLDLHDISRTARTYGVKFFFVVTPLVDQKVLTERIVDHWASGAGARYNPKRGEALQLIRVRESLDDVVAEIRSREGCRPKSVATTAVNRQGSISYARCREKIVKEDVPYLLVFGTAWGLSDELFQGVDFTLAPIMGRSGYNHLSVRSAAAIILDRLTARDRVPDGE